MSIETPAGHVITNSKIDAQMHHHMHIMSPHESWLHTFETAIKPTNYFLISEFRLHLAPMQLETKVFPWLHWFSILERSHLALPPASRATLSHLLTVWSWTSYKPAEERESWRHHDFIRHKPARIYLWDSGFLQKKGKQKFDDTYMFCNFYDLKSKCRNSWIKKLKLGFKKKQLHHSCMFFILSSKLQLTRLTNVQPQVQVTPLDILRDTWRYFWLLLWQTKYNKYF